MAVTRTPRYDVETDHRGRLLTPVAPPAYDTVPVLSDDTGLEGRDAVIATPTEWLTDVRILSDPIPSTPGTWYVYWCPEAAWYAHLETGEPVPDEARSTVLISRIWLVETRTPRRDTRV